DTDGSVAQALRIAGAGADIDRLTAQGVREARNMGEIRRRLRASGCDIPLVADIHFNPKAAFAAAEEVDKVRINPGNFVDPGRTFVKLEYTDEEYARELRKIDDTFVPFLRLCREHGTAIRIGVNHGSLSDRIMSRYGDTPAGMVESAMEFLRVAVREKFSDIVISIKASNTVVMVETVRLLVSEMNREGMSFPLHLGVTEAGDGEDGRVRSAAGIGTLLAEGIGDTIRVSLSEEPEAEVPVARELAAYIASRASAPSIEGEYAPGYNPLRPGRRPTVAVGNVGGDNVPVVVGLDAIPADGIAVLESTQANPLGDLSARIHRMTAEGDLRPVIARIAYPGSTPEQVVLRASADFGALLLNGLIDGMQIVSDTLSPEDAARLSLSILQATRRRVSKTEFVSCPGCGRTLFDLQLTVKRVKEATSHLKGLKIAVMGCIVNG
ncbi:MAG: flavodoxin-dependent (E)-4-hydroxy-3-methylbut-2-enyl-diphosphate synthase, partial [Muribaculaceae bacterium]|nr:flavodoxin-dependent (E)-4-hydroxy-3-methylbut-2-enyl-diphosphate synthase [Muribaculaceae bacterium]